jgi:tripartite-type tricarboxylate transporter receptor subunit TctC
MIGSSPYVMVTYPRLEAKIVQEFIALAKEKRGKLSFGSAGPGSLAHLAGGLFSNMIGAQLIHVPYKSSAQSVTDLMTGRLDMQFATVPPTLPLIRSGQMRALSTTGGKRSAVLPELPTIAEAGLPDTRPCSGWRSFCRGCAATHHAPSESSRAGQGAEAPESKRLLRAQGMDMERARLMLRERRSRTTSKSGD